MKRTLLLSTALLVCASVQTPADTFGTGANQFTIDFVTISGASNPAGGYGIVNRDFRMGTYEITNGQWDKFVASVGGTVTGSPADAYNTNAYWNGDPYYMGANVPTTEVSWYEAAQFVNWLNTSTGHQAAYKFTGTPGTSSYSFTTWSATEAWGGINLYRHKDAFYFLPIEDEWVKAAYWNGTMLQTYATVGDAAPTQSGWNYYDNGHAPGYPGLWDVGSGSQELNGTYDMMGNVWEWMENNAFPGYHYYFPTYNRSLRGGGNFYGVQRLTSTYSADYTVPLVESVYNGFRVASIPEPATLILIGFGALLIRKDSRPV